MSTIDNQIALFKRMLAETPSDVLNELIQEIDKMDIPGPPAEEYFTQFDQEVFSADWLFTNSDYLHNHLLKTIREQIYIINVVYNNSVKNYDVELSWFYNIISRVKTESTIVDQKLSTPSFSDEFLQFSKNIIEEELLIAA